MGAGIIRGVGGLLEGYISDEPSNKRDGEMSVDCLFCEGQCEILKECCGDEIAENFAYVCSECGKIIFNADTDGWPLEKMFVPVLRGQLVEVVVCEQEYRLAHFEDGIDLAWSVFVSRQADIFAFKDDCERWVRLYDPRGKKQGRRARINLSLQR